jgi:hypothetical protein
MAKIQPITTWFKGEEHQANVFSLYSTGDNLVDSATFQYQLIEEIILTTEEQTSQTSQTLLIGQLSINGADYEQWDAEVDANQWIYNWAANKLNLTII